MNINSQNISSVTNLDFFVWLIYLTCIIFLIGACLLVAMLFLKTQRHYTNMEFENRWRLIFREHIVQYQFNPNQEQLQRIMHTCQKWLGYNRIRLVFVDELIQINRVVSGDEKNSIRSLYFQLHLHKYMELRLKQRNQHALITALQEILEFRVQVEPSILETLGKHKHFPISVLAQQVAMEQGHEPYSILMESGERISLAHQIMLSNFARKLIHKSHHQIPELLAHQENSIAQLGVMLTCLLRYQPAYSTIRELA